jgi:hypothetical protein
MFMKVSRLLAMAFLALSACAREAEETTPFPDEASSVSGTAGTESDSSTGSTSASENGPGQTAGVSAAEKKDARAAADGPVKQAAQAAGRNVSAAILEDFNERIDRYMDVRKRAAKGAEPLKETADPARIAAAQDERGAAIRALRADAKPGDIFTAEIRHTFRQLLAPELKGEEGRDTKQILKDDAPAPGAVPLKVNARYPEGAPLPTVPTTLLVSLPQLPKGLEYRIIGKDLVLLDSDANLIVDFIRNAIR